MNIYGHFGPEGAITQFFFKIFSHGSMISLLIQMSFWRVIFNFNPLNRNYLYPPFFPTTKTKEEKKKPHKIPKMSRSDGSHDNPKRARFFIFSPSIGKI